MSKWTFERSSLPYLADTKVWKFWTCFYSKFEFWSAVNSKISIFLTGVCFIKFATTNRIKSNLQNCTRHNRILESKNLHFFFLEIRMNHNIFCWLNADYCFLLNADLRASRKLKKLQYVVDTQQGLFCFSLLNAGFILGNRI